jgi:hypothetical protein
MCVALYAALCNDACLHAKPIDIVEVVILGPIAPS